jgi:hypothetical protein
MIRPSVLDPSWDGHGRQIGEYVVKNVMQPL